MPLTIVVTAKQVMDPEAPVSAFKVDRAARRVVPPQNIPPVVNGFDENAVEAALRIKDRAPNDVRVVVVSMGKSFSLDVMKKPLSMGADELVLLQDDAFENSFDSFITAQVLAAGIRTAVEQVDLVICGRQASDWDNAQVPLGLAELLDMAVVTLGKSVAVQDGKVVVERIVPEGIEVAEAPLPAVVTVSNELGQPRYPTLRGIMAATRKQPRILKAADLGLDPASLEGRLELLDLFVPTSDRTCELIDGESDEEKGRKLAQRLREAKLI